MYGVSAKKWQPPGIAKFDGRVDQVRHWAKNLWRITCCFIRAADDLTNAIAGVVPPPNMTREAVEQLMVIFKQQAKKVKDDATTQRVLKECAQAERVHTESMSNHSPHTPVEVPYPGAKFGHIPETLVILQDEDNTIRAYPAANTWQQRKVRTITWDYLFLI